MKWTLTKTLAIVIFSSLALAPLLASVPTASAILTTSKPDYALGETVYFTLTNTGATNINGTTNNPWTVYKRSGSTWQTAYVPAIAMQNWTLAPGSSKTWSWGQSSNAMVVIDAATYKAEVSISGVGTWSTTFTIGMGSGSGTGSLRIYNNTAGYDIHIDGSYWATALTSTVTVPNVPAGIHQVLLTKSDCQDIEETVTIISGTTTSIHVSMVCGEEQEEEEADDDDDGVPNSEDRCYNPDCNVVDSRGCPKDTDDDGLNDCEDDCPREKGTAANDGCPAEDKDGDGITDDEDACYNPDCDVVDSQGCPKDSDEDGLNDCKDECPSEYGERQNDGCPVEAPKDSDNDGVTDDQDNCYNPGCNRVDPRGCPLDSDNDGLSDCEDNCPNQQGPRSNSGCAQQGICAGTFVLAILIVLGLLLSRIS
ncbi:MAG: thrombospondin type 3 repeat-containing protein [Theionarchaea archaeon]|nr:thrombospondin type 3 repeat-containing protein [Theionarchaea archaeon]